MWPSWASKILRLAVLLAVLVLQATYTANLAAFFSKPSFVMHGPASMEELKESVLCVSWVELKVEPTTSTRAPVADHPRNWYTYLEK